MGVIRLTSTLLAHLPAHTGDGVPAGFEASLAGWLDGARQRWPAVAVDDDTILAYVARRLRAGDALDRLASLDWPELYLACGCSHGDAAALRAFDEAYLRDLPAAIAHFRLPAADVEEIVQEIRDRLLVAGDQPPRIDRYAGDGKLRGLVKVMAANAAVSRLRRRRREHPDPGEDLLRLPSQAPDPELESVKAQLRARFEDAFASAIAELSARERNLLRMHLLEKVTLQALATFYGVHRATVTRWLASARRRLLDATRRRLADGDEPQAGELDSFVALIASRLELSLSRLLGSADR